MLLSTAVAIVPIKIVAASVAIIAVVASVAAVAVALLRLLWLFLQAELCEFAAVAGSYCCCYC